MPNGREGDHPVTDILVYGREVFGPPIDDLIRDIDRLRGYGDPFEPLTELLFEAELDATRRPELRRELAALRDRLWRRRWLPRALR